MPECNTDLVALKRLANSGEMDSDAAMLLDEAHDEIKELRETVSKYEQTIKAIESAVGKITHLRG